MIRRSSIVTYAFVLLAAAGLLSAGLFRKHMDARSQDLQLSSLNEKVEKEHPELALLTVLPGGLRAPFISYQWIRAQELQQDGRYHDALQRASWICALQPRFPGVWDFQAWNMAWNISVETHTPEERWKWVYNGIKLLRDEGIPMNPRSLMLYKSLGWTFFSKVGGDTDEMNYVYKQRWAQQMQHLLGAPPFGRTQNAIAAFEPIAAAPLNKNLPPDPKRLIQADQLKVLQRDAEVDSYARMLDAKGVGVDRSLLKAYNRLSMDHAARSARGMRLRDAAGQVRMLRFLPPNVFSEEGILAQRMNEHDAAQARSERELFQLINSPDHTAARSKMLAFVRAQLLYNEYKMDPQFMLELMKRYQVPLDWRLAQAHGLYWLTYGIKVCDSWKRADINALNTDRTALYCLKDLTWYGLLLYSDDVNDPDNPEVQLAADVRYIEPTHQQNIRFIKDVSKTQGVAFEENAFRDAHRNYLQTAIQMLYPADRIPEAQAYFEYMKKEYNMRGTVWDHADVVDYVNDTINNEGKPIPSVANGQVTMALRSAMLALRNNNVALFDYYYGYARRVYNLYQSNAVPRNKFKYSFEEASMSMMVNIIIDPAFTLVESLTLGDRADIFRNAAALPPDKMNPQVVIMAYDVFRDMPTLRLECDIAGFSFDAIFQPPPGAAVDSP